ncbi:hypothetical protein [Sorangium sp. So ce406]|uniref:hypothetical protein n=1 Tax=Sorangium sp. So ce406 TaxID=3133311 RepID=UPI003F5C8328
MSRMIHSSLLIGAVLGGCSPDPGPARPSVAVHLTPDGSEAELALGDVSVTAVTWARPATSGPMVSAAAFDSTGRRIAASLAETDAAGAWPATSPGTEIEAAAMNDALRLFAASVGALEAAAGEWSGREEEHRRLVALARLAGRYVEPASPPGKSSEALQRASWLPDSERVRLGTYLTDHDRTGMSFLSYQVYANPVGWAQRAGDLAQWIGNYVEQFDSLPELSDAEHSAGVVANGYIMRDGGAFVVAITESAIDLPQPFGTRVSQFIDDAEARHVCTGVVPERTYSGVIDTCFPDGRHETPNVLPGVPEGYIAEGVCNNQTLYEIDQLRLPAGVSAEEMATLKVADCGVPGLDLDDLLVFFPTADWCHGCYLEGDSCCSSLDRAWSWCSDPGLTCVSGVCVPRTPASPCQGLASGYYCAENQALGSYAGRGDIVLCRDGEIAAEPSCPAACVVETQGVNDHCCGDGVCEDRTRTESCATCPADCGACDEPSGCPDGRCDEDETCSTCPQDCGGCPSTCPDGRCDGGEACSTCPQDCGACACGGSGQACCAGDRCDGPYRCNGGTCGCDPGNEGQFTISDHVYPSWGPPGCSGDGTMMLQASAEMLSPTSLRVHVRKADNSAFTSAATLSLYVGNGPTCPGPANVVKRTNAVVIGQREQTIDLTMNPYDGAWGLGEAKTFWVGKDESGFQSFRASGTVSVTRICM